MDKREETLMKSLTKELKNIDKSINKLVNVMVNSGIDIHIIKPINSGDFRYCGDCSFLDVWDDSHGVRHYRCARSDMPIPDIFSDGCTMGKGEK